jgi:hypothetical protein
MRAIGKEGKRDVGGERSAIAKGKDDLSPIFGTGGVAEEAA